MFIAAISRAKDNLELERIKYFIVQRIGSRVFLARIVLGRIHVSQELLESLMGLRLSLKLGLAPLHGWFIRVLRGIN